MNKSQIEYVHKVVARVKLCVMGKIEADIKARLPEKPEERTPWEKYQLIKQGAATVKMNIRMKDIQPPKYNGDQISFTAGFNYPPHVEMEEYKKAEAAIQSEKNDREMAVELAFNRVADLRILGGCSLEEFLAEVERLAQQQW